jgi:hypothetical protein
MLTVYCGSFFIFKETIRNKSQHTELGISNWNAYAPQTRVLIITLIYVTNKKKLPMNLLGHCANKITRSITFTQFIRNVFDTRICNELTILYFRCLHFHESLHSQANYVKYSLNSVLCPVKQITFLRQHMKYLSDPLCLEVSDHWKWFS